MQEKKEICMILDFPQIGRITMTLEFQHPNKLPIRCFAPGEKDGCFYLGLQDEVIRIDNGQIVCSYKTKGYPASIAFCGGNVIVGICRNLTFLDQSLLLIKDYVVSSPALLIRPRPDQGICTFTLADGTRHWFRTDMPDVWTMDSEHPMSQRLKFASPGAIMLPPEAYTGLYLNHLSDIVPFLREDTCALMIALRDLIGNYALCTDGKLLYMYSIGSKKYGTVQFPGITRIASISPYMFYASTNDGRLLKLDIYAGPV